MKKLAIFLLVITNSLYADQEYYQGFSIFFHLQGSDGTRIEPGGINVVLSITDTEVLVTLPNDTETLKAEKRLKFLSGDLVTLSSGRLIRFSNRLEHQPQLSLYSPGGMTLIEIIPLIPKDN